MWANGRRCWWYTSSSLELEFPLFSEARKENYDFGDTPNLAARLQGVAEPNSVVVIAEATRRLLGNLFEFQDLGAKELKGIAGPETAPILLQRMSPFV
jgi:class 3 adenylate cyclase